jgi:endoglycosylceramidase
LPPRSAWRRLAVAIGAAAALATSTAAPSNAAFGGTGRWLTYPDGRVFIPHGLNLVVTKAPFWAPWFGEDDARLLAQEGFTALRITFLPSALEPRIGAYDAAYLQHFVDRARLLARYGIAVLPTLNQDGYTEECGADGFPAWMQLAPCASVWSPFWANDPAADGVGLQDHFLGWWQYVLPRFGTANVLGFDLMNEPVAPDEATLGGFWQRTVTALAAPGRLLFVEPGTAGGTSVGSGLLRGTGLTTHVYCQQTLRKAFAQTRPNAAEIARCIAQDRALIAADVAFATRNGYPLVVGEFGASDELHELGATVDALAAAFVPWLAYAYSARLDGSGTPSQGLLRDDSRPASQSNAKQAKLAVLAVPHAVAVAGTPRAWRFDRKARTVSFAYSTQRAGGGAFSRRLATVVFVPRRVYPTGYAATATGGRIVSSASSPWLRVVADAAVATVRIRIEPRAHGTTLTPLQAARCGYDLGRCGLR